MKRGYASEFLESDAIPLSSWKVLSAMWYPDGGMYWAQKNMYRAYGSQFPGLCYQRTKVRRYKMKRGYASEFLESEAIPLSSWKVLSAMWYPDGGMYWAQKYMYRAYGSQFPGLCYQRTKVRRYKKKRGYSSE
jgi:hypothetical protein